MDASRDALRPAASVGWAYPDRVGLRVNSVLAIAALLVLVGCSSEGSSSERSTANPATTGPGQLEPVAGPAVAVATGSESACAVAGTGSAAGRVWCWSLLDDTAGFHWQSRPWEEPRRIGDLPPVSEIDGSNDEWCALTTAGEVWCWEDQFRYAADAQAPTPIELPGPATSVAVGPHRGCALVAGDAWCWQRHYGMRPAERGQPVHTDLGSAAVAVVVGESHMCALLADQSTRCWGTNSSGELGDGHGQKAFDRSDDPVTPVGLGPAVAVALGSYDSCVVLAEGTVSCWGNHPALPPGSMPQTKADPLSRTPCYECFTVPTEMRTPLPVDGADGAVSISSATGPGVGAVCVLRSDATVTCWGPPYGGRLGRDAPPNRNGTFARTPVAIPGLRDIT